ncbi:MAG: ABC transporter permease [Candidatus Kariarchaeaceae archaeon]
MSNDFGVEFELKDKFSFKRMISVTKRVLRQLVRDRRTFGMILALPIVIMLIFGTALSGEVKNVPIIIQNEDNPYDPPGLPVLIDAGTTITDSLLDDDRVKVDPKEQNWDRAVELVEDGEFSAVVRIPSTFSESLFNRIQDQSVELTLYIYIDGTKPSIRASIMGALQEALQDALGGETFTLEETLAYGNAEYEGLDVAIPAVMALVLTFLVLLISLVTIIRDKLYGTQNRLYATPLTKLERLLGFVLALSIIGMLMAVSVISIGTLIFGAEVRGSLFLLVASAYLYAVSNIFLAVFLSNFAENELQAIQFAPLIAFPSMALSGMLVPVNTMPELAQIVSDFIPMSYGVTIFEGIMLKGQGIADLGYEYLILNLYALIAFILAILTVKDKMD